MRSKITLATLFPFLFSSPFVWSCLVLLVLLACSALWSALFWSARLLPCASFATAVFLRRDARFLGLPNLFHGPALPHSNQSSSHTTDRPTRTRSLTHLLITLSFSPTSYPSLPLSLSPPLTRARPCTSATPSLCLPVQQLDTSVRVRFFFFSPLWSQPTHAHLRSFLRVPNHRPAPAHPFQAPRCLTRHETRTPTTSCGRLQQLPATVPFPASVCL